MFFQQVSGLHSNPQVVDSLLVSCLHMKAYVGKCQSYGLCNSCFNLPTSEGLRWDINLPVSMFEKCKALLALAKAGGRDTNAVLMTSENRICTISRRGNSSDGCSSKGRDCSAQRQGAGSPCMSVGKRGMAQLPEFTVLFQKT